MPAVKTPSPTVRVRETVRKSVNTSILRRFAFIAKLPQPAPTFSHEKEETLNLNETAQN